MIMKRSVLECGYSLTKLPSSKQFLAHLDIAYNFTFDLQIKDLSENLVKHIKNFLHPK